MFATGDSRSYFLFVLLTTYRDDYLSPIGWRVFRQSTFQKVAVAYQDYQGIFTYVSGDLFDDLTRISLLDL
jgi:hypothetical protein